MGFEYFYGFFGGDTDQFYPNLYENTNPTDAPYSPDEGYHLDVDLADRAIDWISTQKNLHPDKPFFTYFAPGTAHAPHHAPREWIAKFRGKFDSGWDAIRLEVFERQKQMGVVPDDATLPPRHDSLPAWDSLTDDERVVAARHMEVFAAALSHADWQIGRVIESLGSERENTLIVYVAGDNGPAAEGSIRGVFNKWASKNDEWLGKGDAAANSVAETLGRLDELGGPNSYPNYPAGWAYAGATPFRWFKQVASHFGGTRNGMVISWPSRLGTTPNRLRTQFHHVVDVVPTILECVGLPAPQRVHGVEQSLLAGVSMTYSFDDPTATKHRSPQYFEIFGNRALSDGEWMAGKRQDRLPWSTEGARCEFTDDDWELWNLESDFTQSRDLADEYPERLRELISQWWREAERNQVLPLDDRFKERSGTEKQRQGTSKRSYVFHPRSLRIPEILAPNVKGRSHRFEIDVEFGEGDSGVLVSAGGRFGGYAIYVKDGRLCYCHNFVGVDRYYVRSLKLPAEDLAIVVSFATDAPKLGSGGTVAITVNGEQFGSGHVDRTVPSRYSYTETFDIGRDTGSPVTDEYSFPGFFTGKVREVRVHVTSDLDEPTLREEQAIAIAIEESSH